MKFLIDKEVNLKENDFLNSESYSQTLKQIISDSPDSSFTIGLFGEWGSGKSSIIKTASDDLSVIKKPKIKFVIYDAWKYANDSFRRMFLFKLQEELKFEKTEYFDSFYKNKNSDVKITKKTNWTFFIITGLILVAGIIITKSLNDLDNKAIAAIITAFAGIAVNIFGNTFVDYKVTVQEPMFFAPEQFEECFEEMVSSSLQPTSILNTLKKFIKGENYVSGLDKLVIVVDNIDRCPKELAYELLTNIKNFLKEKKNLIFLIPVDDDALKRHVMKGGANTHKEADEFLRKFFNVTLRIKPFKRFDLYEFTCQINNKYELNLSPTTLDIISKEYATNPRRIIQFFNNLTSELHVFSIKYGEEFVKKNESLICKLLIIREEWPDYYKTLSNNPDLLNNQGKEIKEELQRTQKELDFFLEVTNSINFNTSYETIEKLFSTHNRVLRIPAIVLEAITKKDIQTLEKQVEEKVIQKRNLVDELIERINIGMKRELYQTEVNNLLEVVCKLNQFDPLEKDENRRIHDEIGKNFPKIVPHVSDLKALCIYSTKIEEQGFNYIETYLTEKITNGITVESHSDYALAKKLFLAYVNSNKISKIKSLSKIFTKEYSKAEQKIEFYEFSPEILEQLIEGDLLYFIITELKEFSEGDKYYIDLVYLSKIILLNEDIISKLFEKANEVYPNLIVIEKDFLISIFKNLNEIFTNKTNVINNQSKIISLNNLYTRFCEMRLSHGINKPIVDLFETNEERLIALNFIINVYRISSGKIDVKSSLERLIINGFSRDTIYQAIIDLIDLGNINLLLLKDIIFKDQSFTKTHLQLLEYFFKLKEATGYSIDDTTIKEKLLILIRFSINSQNHEVIEFLEKIIDEERCNKLLKEIIESLNKDDIIRLTQKLCFLAFNKICEGDNIFEYEENTDLLKAIATKGTTNHISRLLRFVKAKLQREEKINEALDILEEIDALTENQISSIKGDIENIVDLPLKEEAMQMLSNKNSNPNLGTQGLIILKAIYYSQRNRVERNITRKIRKLVSDNKLSFAVTNDLVDSNDPDDGQVKKLKLEYIYNGVRDQKEFDEHTTLTIPKEKAEQTS